MQSDAERLSYEYFTEALKCFALDESAPWTEPLKPAVWEGLIKLAKIHNALAMVYEAIARTPAFAAADEQTRTYLKRSATLSIAVQASRTRAFKAVYTKLTDAGAKPLVLKGLACRDTYARGDHRPSADEDILVSAGEFSLCDKILCDSGFTKSGGTEGEAAYKGADGEYIELHTALFPKNTPLEGAEPLFKGVFERALYVRREGEGFCYYTLPHEEHILFLALHAMQHFMFGGVGVRQAMDIMMYLNAYGDKLDYAALCEALERANARVFMAAVLDICITHLGFDPIKAGVDGALYMPCVDGGALLEDMLCAGVFGTSTPERRHSANITLEAARGGTRAGGMLKSVFPPASTLENRFGYLKKAPLLLPVAWAQRLILYAREGATRGGRGAADAVKLGSSRAGLLKIYGIIK